MLLVCTQPRVAGNATDADNAAERERELLIFR